ncbi:MAG: type II secretion system protein, partial [Campylobacterota bacterium]|nr:type II secretion system protein [Campylobacterota bacterium]
MKKSFTLIEVVISIVLLSIIVVFLSKSLYITEKSNKFFKLQLEEKIDINEIKDIIFKDIIYSYELKNLNDDNNKNTIFSLKT